MRPRTLPLAFAIPFLLAAAAAAAAPPAPAKPAPPDAAKGDARRLDRIQGLCRAWNAAKYLHPGLWSSDVDWDAAFVKAATTVDGTPGNETYRAVASEMLSVLHDPATRVDASEDGEAPAAAAAPAAPASGEKAEPELVRWLGDDVLLVDLVGYQRAKGPYSLFALGEKLAPEVPKAKGVVVDLRFGKEETSYWAGAALDRAAGQLVPRAVQTPASRWVVRWGYEPQRGSTSGGYRSGLVTGAVEAFAPAGAGGTWRIVFLVSEGSPLVEVVQALLASGDAKLVSDGPFHPEMLAAAAPIDLGEKLVAHVRAVEEIGAAPPEARIVAKGSDAGDPALDAALALLEGPWQPPVVSTATAAPGVRRLDNRYADQPLPPLGLRLLAGCRAWGVIHHFYPYLDLIGDWDAAFRDSIPELTAAADEAAYARAVLALMAHVADGHTYVGGGAVPAVLGAASPHLQTRLIEGQPVVTAFDPAIHGLQVGDIVVKVDGEPIEQRIDELLPLVTASMEVNHRLRALSAALDGPEGSTAKLDVVGADGEPRRVDAPREVKGWEPAPPAGAAWKRLRPRIGYADLTRLQREEVDPMLEELRDTDALVLDMRGYPNGTAWPLAARLNTRDAKTAALFRRREVSALDPEEGESGYFFAQPLPEKRSWTYKGKVVMLIDERAISQSEHTALFMEQAAGATFIGSPTAGANGDVTNFSLPGGLMVSFTGHDVRHADGRQLQRVGIVPDVAVTPTLRGIREGRDEVLDRALAWLDDALSKPAR
ncbi:MAG TPA: S41 family peptidase [Thermoanaerobaculia bacterium]|jgi:C-terminal processing protease CtpA/Prc|nr:S41 family peptidase [Thermoanaerobaculia bacterium]